MRAVPWVLIVVGVAVAAVAVAFWTLGALVALAGAGMVVAGLLIDDRVGDGKAD
jgi:hypothetical protein